MITNNKTDRIIKKSRANNAGQIATGTFSALAMTACLLFCLALSANAAVIDAKYIEEMLKQDLLEQIQQQHEGKVEVEVTGLPYRAVDLPDGKLEVKADISSSNLSSSIVKVKIYVDGEKVKSFGARVDIKIYDKVWVAQSWIKRGESLKDLMLEEKEISSGISTIPGEDFDPVKYLARRNIKPGEVINMNYIEEIPTIVKDSPVSLIFKTPQVSVTIPGVALSSGKTGDFIKVKNTRYRKNYVGKIIGKNIVLVHI